MSIPSTQPLKQFVRAGAGAGKTWNLTREVIKQALEHKSKSGKWPKTVVTTFTRKATQELKERMLIYCLEEKPEALDYVQSSNFLNITTMHGLLSTFLSRMGFKIGLPSHFKVINSQKADYWRMQILKSMISEGYHTKELQAYDFKRILENLKQYESIFWEEESQTLVFEDFKNLMRETLLEYSKNLSELAREVKNHTEGEKWDLYWNDLSHFCQTLKLDEPWDVLSKKISQDYARLKKPNRSKKNPGLPEDKDDILKTLLSDVKEFANDPQYSIDSWTKMSATFLEFNKFANAFMGKLKAKKIEEAALEASDLEFFSLHLIKNYAAVVPPFSDNFDNWFIDEFQDTSPLQLKILDPIIGEKSCYLVGDPQQSIYLFRGSRSEVFLHKEIQMKESQAKIQFLIENYRSQKSLLSFINDFFPKIDSSFSSMEFIKDSDKRSSATVIAHFTGDEVKNEVYFIADNISRKLESGASLKDFCILTRTHRDSEFIQKELMKLGFPVISHSSSQFYQRREVLDGFSLLQLLLNPWDDQNLILFLRSPWMTLTDAKILEIKGDLKENFWLAFRDYFQKHSDFYPGQCLLEAFANKKKWGVGWVFRKTMLRLGLIDQSLKVESTGRREANLWKIINMIEKSTREPSSSLLQLIKEGVEATTLEQISDGADASSPVEPNKINLMTIHASKGLQFKYVFIPYLHKKPRETTYADFCHDQSRKKWSMRVPVIKQEEFVGGLLEKHFVKEMKQRENEESLRLFYVAATRAEDELFLSWSDKPQKKSWALLLQQYIEGQGDADVYDRYEQINLEPTYYHLKTQTSDVADPFSNNAARFLIAPEAFNKSVERESWESWSQVVEQQNKRWRGVILHRLFENLKNHSLENVFNLAKLWMPEQNKEIDQALKYIVSNVDLPMTHIIESGFVEWGYQRMEQDQTIERRVDLWGIYNEELWIVDYKTGSVEYKEKAFEQMREYKKALVKYLRWDKNVKLAAVYPFSQQSFVKEMSFQ